MVSHSTEQQCVIIWWSKSDSTIFGSSWRSFQGPHVPFKLEQFQFFPLTSRTKVQLQERIFLQNQSLERRRLKVIQSLFLSIPLCFCITFLFCFLVFESVQFYALYLYILYVRLFSVLFCFFLHNFFFEKSEKYKNSVCLCILVLVYPGQPLKQSFLTWYLLQLR